ncbi:putative Zn-dependent peptidase [Actinoalloteichus hoggarensis]|uniref:Peptidase M16 inactive domain protein n=1 Tax=Actinoalloteichus hoggarensis TaxID=1470176 RepID=A0A221VZB1_9PSEU|nr:pitrilysin family protein [Actinoalloteichus hoggarensis]ASO18591.1 Peptidase M16 inactive domain protein [Actinoalloteichus hoggarensis]MBB5921959.1 putative Zn-dependent peptidase [Actinoalloteichus hoggarensis]
MNTTTHRTAEQIGRTETGPRPLPELGVARLDDPPVRLDAVLENGLRLIAVRQSSVPMVEMRMSIPFAGESEQHSAVAELLATTMLTGTERRDRVLMDTDLAGVGADLRTVVDPERLRVSGSTLSSGLDTFLDVVSDALTSAAYREAEVLGERDRLAERINVARSQPRVIAREALQRRRFGDHPYTREMPRAVDVLAVEPAEVRLLHGAAVVPRGATLVLVGDIDLDRIADTVSRALAGWHSERGASVLPRLPLVDGGDLLLVDRPGAVQSQIRLSAQAVTRLDPRFPALQLANVVFGGYFSSRLVENIREDKGYTYSAHSSFEYTPQGAVLDVDADTASEVTAAAVLEMRYELGRIGVVPPSKEELDSAREYLIGSLLISTASQGGLAGTLSGLASIGVPLDWLQEHPDRLRTVTPEQVGEAAREFFTPTAFTGVVVGDAETLAGPLRALGGVALP